MDHGPARIAIQAKGGLGRRQRINWVVYRARTLASLAPWAWPGPLGRIVVLRVLLGPIEVLDRFTPIVGIVDDPF